MDNRAYATEMETQIINRVATRDLSNKMSEVLGTLRSQLDINDYLDVLENVAAEVYLQEEIQRDDDLDLPLHFFRNHILDLYAESVRRNSCRVVKLETAKKQRRATVS